MRCGILSLVTASSLVIGGCTDTPVEIAPASDSWKAGAMASVAPMATISDPCPTCTGIFLTRGGYSWDVCYIAPGGDADRDHIDDGCEAQLAVAFAPELRLSYTDDDVSRETYWAVGMSDDPDLDRTLRIFYALGYHQDTGISPFRHKGDSEFVELHVTFDPTLT